MSYGKVGSSLNEGTLWAMVGQLAHRGPDQAAVHLSADRKVGLGFRRLAIVDLSPAGHQPMANEDGSVWIVFNGEIYNHADHRPMLQDRGHRFRGRSDTETLLALYEEFGMDCLRWLRGMFAFAVWDAKLQRLWMVRDRLGVKPLYYRDSGGELIFGSEIKAILANPAVERDLDPDALSQYLTFYVPPAPQTMFKGVSKLPAAHYMTVDASGASEPVEYWDPFSRVGEARRPSAEVADEVRTRLNGSVKGMLMSDVPYGAFLSGGVDSSANVAFMSEHSPSPVNTFSIGFHRYERCNELDHARQVAQRYGTNHHEVMIDDKDAAAYLPSLVRTQDEPLADWVCVPLYFLAKLARDSGVPVVHIGEGADELFAGYPSYLSRLRLERNWDTLRRAPSGAWRAGSVLAGLVARVGVSGAERLSRLLDYLSYEDGRYWGNAVAFRGQAKTALLSGPYWKARPAARSEDVVDRFHRELDARGLALDPLQRLTAIELRQRLPELLLMRVDKLTMANSIEARVPYLDHELVELAMSVPMDMKIEGNQPKSLLKRSLAPVLTPDILARPKQGFAAPVSEWFRDEMRDEVRHVLLDGRIHERGYFDVDVIRSALDAHQQGRRDLSARLWTLYNLFHWYDEWIA